MNSSKRATHLGYFCQNIFHQELLKSPNLVTLLLSKLINRHKLCIKVFLFLPDAVKTFLFISAAVLF